MKPLERDRQPAHFSRQAAFSGLLLRISYFPAKARSGMGAGVFFPR
jgi:hypothetical protein